MFGKRKNGSDDEAFRGLTVVELIQLASYYRAIGLPECAAHAQAVLAGRQ